MNRKLPPALTGAFVTSTVLALLLGCCSAYSTVGVAGQIAVGSSFEEGGAPGSDTAELMEMHSFATRMGAVQVVLHIVAALALGIGGGMGLSGRPIGRPIALVAFAIAGSDALFDVVIAVWSWSLYRDLMPTGSPEESQMMSAIFAVTILPSAAWILLRLAVVGGGTAALFSSSARAFYANVGPEGVRGPRE